MVHRAVTAGNGNTAQGTLRSQYKGHKSEKASPRPQLEGPRKSVAPHHANLKGHSKAWKSINPIQGATAKRVRGRICCKTHSVRLNLHVRQHFAILCQKLLLEHVARVTPLRQVLIHLPEGVNVLHQFAFPNERQGVSHGDGQDRVLALHEH